MLASLSVHTDKTLLSTRKILGCYFLLCGQDEEVHVKWMCLLVL